MGKRIKKKKPAGILVGPAVLLEIAEMTVIVAGITRSGLSLTMQMIWAGGYPCKGEPPAFECFNLGEIPWLECDAHAVKLVDAHLQLPPDGDYRVIRLARDPVEQARSFNKWNCTLFRLPSVPTSRIMGSIRRDYEVIDAWAKQQRGWMVLEFEKLIEHPRAAVLSIQEFGGVELDIDRMESVVVKRSPRCFNGLLEEKLILTYESMVK